ncbi:RHS repeat domain-containing protein [Arcticibacter sp. MXS-1]|uniref:RHS repeat domain-containing protein n=1 Tax=Arcticibacter sp. MXS-1 TaxID=3341726 RepID=UPI0035A9A6ED
MSYAYKNSGQSNRLASVTDASGNDAGQLNGTAEYTYDDNGNLIKDSKKGIEITYNQLNLPSTITKGNGTIRYIYDAAGRKLRKEFTGNTRDYIGGIEYGDGGQLDFVQTEEGRAIKSGDKFSYEYMLKDHLGNTRAVVKENGEILQLSDYYAFGMEMAKNKMSPSPDNRYKYNGKELQEDMGLNHYDYGARFYDPVIGRWTTIDPKAEKFLDLTPYNYGFNNPILIVDLDGREGIVVIGQPGDHKNKNHFIDNGLARAKALAKEYKKAGNGEKATILVYKGKDGSASFSDKQIASLEKSAGKAGVNVRVVESGDDVVDYVNNKTGGDSRSEDLVSNFTYVGHATPGDLDIGWVNHGALTSAFSEELDVSQFNKSAFTSNSNADLVAACRTAVPGIIERSVAEQMADKVGGVVQGSNVRVQFDGGVRTNQQLLRSNNGRVVIIQGRGGVSKQSQEHRRK